MRNISFSLTTEQFRNRTKTVTRRLGWQGAQVGDILMGVEKGMGLKKGEKVVRLGKIRILNVRREPVSFLLLKCTPKYGESEVIKEGFSNLTPAAFVKMFCSHNKCEPCTKVTRIEFEYL